MSVERDIRYELLARLCPNSTGTHDNEYKALYTTDINGKWYKNNTFGYVC